MSCLFLLIAERLKNSGGYPLLLIKRNVNKTVKNVLINLLKGESGEFSYKGFYYFNAVQPHFSFIVF